MKDVSWDYTGQFLAVAASGGISVQAYVKAEKAWTEVLAKGIAGTAVVWSGEANSLVLLNSEGGLVNLA